VLTEEAGTERCWKKKNSKARLIPKAGSGEGGGGAGGVSPIRNFGPHGVLQNLIFAQSKGVFPKNFSTGGGGGPPPPAPYAYVN